jgi:hypothetical protein
MWAKRKNLDIAPTLFTDLLFTDYWFTLRSRLRAFLCFGPDFNRHVRATQLTQPAGCAVFYPIHDDLFILIQFKNVLRAKGYTDPAPLAKIPVDLNPCLPFLFGRFSHPISPGNVACFLK